MPFVTRVGIPTAKTPTQKVAVSKANGGRPTALSEGRLSLADGVKQMKAFEHPSCSFHNRRNHSLRMEITLQIEDVIRGIMIIWYKHPTSNAMKIPAVNIASEERFEEILLQKDTKNSAQLGMSFFSSTNPTLSMNMHGGRLALTEPLGPPNLGMGPLFGSNWALGGPIRKLMSLPFGCRKKNMEC